MSWPENRLIDINLPEFILNFNNKCVSFLLPFIETAIKYLQNAESPILLVLLFIAAVQILRTSLMTLPQQQAQVDNYSQAQQISKQVKDLKRELKSIQNMIIQIKNANPSTENSQLRTNQSSSKLIESCKNSLRKREELATQIMDWNLKLVNQVIKLKNKNRSSRSPSKVSPSSCKQLNNPTKKSHQSVINSQLQHRIQITKPLFKSSIKEQEIKKIQTFIESSVSIIKQQRQNSQIKIEASVVEQKKSTKIQISQKSSNFSLAQEAKIIQDTENEVIKPQTSYIVEEAKYPQEREPPKSTVKFVPPKNTGKLGKPPIPMKRQNAPAPKIPKIE